MTWLRIDDGFTEHPTIDALSAEAFKLHVAALCYCARNLTDGRVPKLAAMRLTATAKARHADELATAGLWTPCPDGWVIRNYLEFNPSKENVERERRAARDRQRSHRESRRDKAVTLPVTNAVSHAAPSRPDPSIELSSSSEEPPAVDNSDEDERIQPALEIVADRRSTGKNARYRSTVLANLRGDDMLDVEAARRLAEYPALTAAQLADVLCGATNILATARRATA